MRARANSREGSGSGSLARFLGHKVRRMRKDAGLTLEQVAAASQISTGALSQLERGLGNPSLHTLFQVAASLGASPASLLQGEPARSPVVRKAERHVIDNSGEPDDALLQLVTPVDTSYEVLWCETPAGYCTEATPFVHKGTETLLVVNGHREVHLGDETFVLEPGDAITFSSDIPHWYRNLDESPVTAVWVNVPDRAAQPPARTAPPHS